MTDSVSFCRCSCYECVVQQSSRYEKAKNYKKAGQIYDEAIEFMENTVNRLKTAKLDLSSRMNARNVKLDSTRSDEKENCPLRHNTSEVRHSKATRITCYENHKIPVAVFDEPEDPNKKPMYPKHLVYANGKDIQLEELRAADYWKKVQNGESRVHNAISTAIGSKPATNRKRDKDVQATVISKETSMQTEPQNVPVNEVCTQTEPQFLPVTQIGTETEAQITLVEKSTNLEKGTIQLKSSVTDRTENDDTLTPVENIVRIKSEANCDNALKPIDIKPNVGFSQTFVISCKDTPTSSESTRESEETDNCSIITRFSSAVEFEDSLTECDTKAFKLIPSTSTPFHSKDKNKLGNEISEKELKNETFTHTKPAANLSMILELSKERFSQSTQSNSSGKINTVGIGSKTIVLSKHESIPKENSEDETCIDNRINLETVRNPFDGNLIDYFLKRAQLGAHLPGYVSINSDIPSIRPFTSVKLGSEKYKISEEIGKGAYARILKVRPENNSSQTMALKHQKPACVWEWYISQEIHHRLNDKEKEQFFVHYSKVYIFKNASLMLSDWAPCGTILSLVSSIKNPTNSTDRCPMAVCVHLSMQLITAIHYLHSCQIIHGDVKPDNFVLVPCPSSPMLLVKLIDFGRSIDMKLFPPNQVFDHVVTTEDFTCNEMKERKPWSYQIDLFGLAATIYLLLMGDYMKAVKKSDVWMPKKSISRYLHPEVWTPILETLLNVPSNFDLPDLTLLKKKLEEFFSTFNKFTLNQQMTCVFNIINKK